MAQNIVFRWRKHFLICVGFFMIAEILPMIILCRSIWIVLIYIIYIRIAFLLKLTEFYSEKWSNIVLGHIALTIMVALAALALNVPYKITALLFLIMNITYVIWLFLAEKWMHWQISAVSTIVIDITGEAGKWAEKHKNIYHIEATYKEEDIVGIENDIKVFKIPMILTEKEPSDTLYILARQYGVMLHYILPDNSPGSIQMTEIPRYKGLYTYTPEL